MSGPISPDEARSGKAAAIPEAVYEIFNAFILERFDGRSAVVTQDAVAQRIADRLGVARQTVFNRHWLDVEDAYRATGWTVEYDKPGYNETYPATFTFKVARSKPEGT